MAKIVGLDLGTNSIGWAVVDNDKKCIEAAGSRIIPMDASRLSDFEKGNTVSFTAERTQNRGMRRLRERYLLRRERLLRVLHIMGFLPVHFDAQLDRYGKLLPFKEPKLAWREGKDGRNEFLFRSSFDEMVADFRKAGYNGNIPYDWTIYYLRTKSLNQPLSKEELAWVLLQFNQKRGYYQLRGKQDELDSQLGDKGVEKEYRELKVVSVVDTGEKHKNGSTWYDITLENGWIYHRPCRIAPDWVGKSRGFIATFKLDKDGNRKAEQPSLRAPEEKDWGLRKIRTEETIRQSGLTVGAFIYKSLIENPSQKIIGELVSVVDRKYYLDELHRILEKQKEFIPELTDVDLYCRCLEALYPNNEAYRNSIAKRNFAYLLADNILFYQRPLKTKTALIKDCPYEKRNGKAIKCIAKSHPLFQEFRLWQFLSNLRIERSGVDVTAQLLPNTNEWERLYEWLSIQKNVNEKSLLKYFKIGSSDIGAYRWNYVQDKDYPAGETRAILLGGLRKAGISKEIFTAEFELQLWHILYSIDEPIQYEKALHTFARKQGWDKDREVAFCQVFKPLTVYKEKDYGAYSAKAISRLLPLMRCGKYWNKENIDKYTRQRIMHLITGEADESLTVAVRERFKDFTYGSQFQQLNTWQACYLVYGRHSETSESKVWTSPDEIDSYLKNFRHHSLNNPVVEQVVTESLRVIRDIWRQYGRPDEIHIELGRELKKTKDERKRLTQVISEGEATNQRIRLLLTELMNPECQVENVRPQSPSQHELLKIYEEGVLGSNVDIPDDINDIRKRFTSAKNQPTHAEVMRYKLWLDQKYISPYTGTPIPLAKLFTPAYQIEHVIPQSRWFDDSMSNKVICEAEVNQLKNRELGHEFIVNHHGERVRLNLGGTVNILSVEAYEKLMGNLFANNHTKYKKMMLDEIPDDFNARQLVDSRYISRLMMPLLSNIVRSSDEEGNQEESAVSKNVIPCNGSITDRLKYDWGLDDVWNRIILPRFQRLNMKTNTSLYTATTANGHQIPQVPLGMRQGFNKKRIDHRHHAMDAIVIACCTRDHINLLNNEAAKNSSVRYDLQHKLRNTEYYFDKEGNQHLKFTTFIKPWQTFTEDSFRTLSNIVVSFKQNLRVINKTTNRYQVIRKGKYISLKQEKGDNWAIRKPLHKETVFREVNLQLVKKVAVKKALEDISSIVSHELKEKVKEKKSLGYSDKQVIDYLEKNKDVWREVSDGKVEVYYYTKDSGLRYFATRKELLSYMSGCSSVATAENAIESITDSGIRAILRAHLTSEGNNAAEAFSAEGLERMNLNIKVLNGGRNHQPIKKVSVFEQANKFSVGTEGQKATKFVESAQGTNLFFVIYTDSKGIRNYATIPLKPIIDLQKQYQKEWKQHVVECLQLPTGCNLLFILSPGDLVYIPIEDETPTLGALSSTRIYRVVSCDGLYISCIPVNSAKPILDKFEYESPNKMKTTLDKKYMIREVCIPLRVDRLGNIISIG